MSERHVIDPITRIEGHLRVEIEVENGYVKDAWSSGTLWRGFEVFLKGRDPRDAWFITQRVCGVCTEVHALASVKCVEDAIGIKIPDNARLVRNLIHGAQYLHDHIVHFYHLHALDWVDVVSALKADPKKTSELANSVNPNAPKSGPGDFKVTQDKLKKFVNAGQLGPFTNGYWGHPAYKLPPEANLMAVSHYLDALSLQSRIARLHAIFGAKNPHIQTYLVGGVTCVNDLNVDRISEFIGILEETKSFVDNVYIPDILAVAPFYLEWAGIGGGLKNYLSYGMFPQKGGDEPGNLWFPRGYIKNRDLTQVYPVDVGKIEEEVTHSWYKYAKDAPLHPSVGETDPWYTGIETDKPDGKYSWLKTPRYDGMPMEVGVLSRMLVNYVSGHEATVENVNWLLKTLGAGPEILFSTLGRTAARAVETKIIGDEMRTWIDELLANIKRGDLETCTDYTMPDSAKGFGLTEAPRGALGHWIEIKGGKIGNYQLVVPTTWNGSPRDRNGLRSAIEESLVGTPIVDPARPVEILRTVHSFDPCLACSVHVFDPKTNETFTVRAV
ncbi:Uptake [NiFe] hydrogenase, large subunit HyaB [hydrothermal vent metagenome]|uniref:Uptake [NiFe] hydrogenase, large subunit HyaB n=1 Tax=hydrothermal vent metagenome TaxID=652676 RepID=A0A3B1C1R4_9ZZZZ